MSPSTKRPSRCAPCVLLVLLYFTAQSRADETLIRFDSDSALSAIKSTDSKIAIRDGALEITTGRKNDWPGVTLHAAAGHWDLAAYERVSIDVKNLGRKAAEVALRVDNPGADGISHCLTGNIRLLPGEQKLLSVALSRKMPESLEGKLFGMRGMPSGWSEKGGLDPANVNQLVIFVPRPKSDHHLQISNVIARLGPTAERRRPVRRRCFL